MQKVTLRYYQEAQIQVIREAFRRGLKSDLVESRTGSGKTTTLSELARLVAVLAAIDKRWRVCVIAHTDRICQQLRERLEVFGINAGMIKAGYPEELDKIARLRASKHSQTDSIVWVTSIS